MKHEITIDYRTLFNILCAASAYYKEYKAKLPEIFDKQDEQELTSAIKLQKFCLETGVDKYKLEDVE